MVKTLLTQKLQVNKTLVCNNNFSMEVLLYLNSETSEIKQKLTFPYIEMIYEKDSIEDLWGKCFFF